MMNNIIEEMEAEEVKHKKERKNSGPRMEKKCEVESSQGRGLTTTLMGSDTKEINIANFFCKSP